MARHHAFDRNPIVNPLPLLSRYRLGSYLSNPNFALI